MACLLFVDNSESDSPFRPINHWAPLLPSDFRYVDATKGELKNLNAGDFSHVILSGSDSCTLDEKEWMLEEEDFIRALVRHKIPLLGNCFGHQLLAKTLFGREAVRKRSAVEIGWKRIRILEDDPLMGRRGDVHSAFAFHYDEVVSLPPEEATVLAQSGECDVHAFRLNDLPAWGVQAHFEIGVTQAVKMMKDSRYAVDAVQKGIPPLDTGHVVTMVGRFLNCSI